MAFQLKPLALTWDAVDPAWAWAPYEPGGERPWTRELAAHLLRRAAFAPNWQELEAATAAGPSATIDRLLATPPEAAAFRRQIESAAQPILAADSVEQLPAWWLYSMLFTPQPLLEKVTLFWHGHFATSAAKVTKASLMYRQHVLLRDGALGKFGPLLKAAAKDPAMLVWLDSTTNHKAHANENFAREVMELFGLGRGAYTETDIKQAARAFTGRELRGEAFWFNRRQHDDGVKTIFGKSGSFDGDQVIDLLLEQPACARFLVSKLFRCLVSDAAELPPRLLNPLAEEYQQQDYDTARLLKRILGSNLFFSPLAVRQKIKGPVEFAIGLLRSLGSSANAYSLADDLRGLGQGVFYPPNVKGWDGGAEWINSSTLLGRTNLAWSLVSGTDDRYQKKPPLVELLAKQGVKEPADQARWLADLLIAAPLPEPVYVQLTALAGDANGGDHLRLARVVQAIAALPEYQLA